MESKSMVNITYSKMEIKHNWIFAAIIFFASFLLYAKTLHFDFSYLDDDEIILNNSAIFKGKVDIKKIFTTDSSLEKQINFLYRPLQTLSYAIDTKLSGGINPWMYHLTNVVLFAFIGCILYLLFRKFNFSDKISFLGTILFIVHPMFTMPVSWIPARGDLFLTLFSILSMTFFIDFVKERKYYHFSFSALFFLLALFSKETAAFLPFIFLLYFFCFQEKPKINKKHILFGFVLFAEGLIWFYLRTISINSEKTVFTLKHLLNIPTALSQLIVLPLDFSPLPVFTVIKTVIGIVVLAFLFYLVCKKDEIPKMKKFFYLSWFVLLLAPIFFSPQPNGLDYLDHRFLLPVIGVFLLLLSAIPEKRIKGKILFPFVLIAVVLPVVSFNKSNVYKNPEEFYGAAIKNNPANALAYNNRALYRRSINDLEGSLNDCNQAILLDKKDATSYYNRGSLKHQIGDLTGALDDYNYTIFYEKEYAVAYYNRGLLNVQTGNYSEALDDFNNAILYDKENVAAYYNNRGRLKDQTGDFNGALDDYNKAIQFDKNDFLIYYNRGILKGQTGDIAGAIVDFDNAIRLKADCIEAYTHRAAAKSMSGNTKGAMDDVNLALKIQPDNIEASYIRAVLFFEMNDREKALQDCERILKKDPDNELTIQFKNFIISNLNN